VDLDKAVTFSELQKELDLVHLDSCAEYCWHHTPTVLAHLILLSENEKTV
jgi:hypothetical protein